MQKQQQSDPTSTGGKKKDTMRCRGCMPDCKNKAVCEGKPWRTLVPYQGKIEPSQLQN